MTEAKTGAALSRAPSSSRGCIMLADGSFFEGVGFGAPGAAVGEVCFNTAMTGYQEILSDPSYAGQIVAFTFPHIGVVGTNAEDIETITPAVRGLIVRADAEAPSNYRSLAGLDRWLKAHGIPAVAGIDTRALTNLIREKGMPHGVIANAGEGTLDKDALLKQARAFPGLVGLDLAKDVTSRQMYKWSETPWAWDEGYGLEEKPSFRATVLDYGVKRNILRMLAGLGADITVLPANASLDDVMRTQPHGVLLSNGPGDPAATGEYAIPTIKGVVDSGVPIFGICLGHQMLSLALGAKTTKMAQGHHGANHPVKDLTTGKVEIVSMNHGFTVDRESLPDGVSETHVSLFDGTNCGIAVDGKDVFSVQYHPEASPGPMDSHYLFTRFADAAKKRVSPIKFALAEANRKLADADDNFVTLMTGKQARLLLFAPEGEDRQTPHTQDEFYIVVAGSGSFRRGDEVVPFAKGDVLFVPAQTPHRFESFSDDFQTWVIFFGPRVEAA